MSKKRDFEYSGKLDEVKQTDDDLKSSNPPNHQASNQPPASNSNSNQEQEKEYNDEKLNNDSPDVMQHNDDLKDNETRPKPSNDDNRANDNNKHGEDNGVKQTENEPNQNSNDLEDSNDKNSNNNSDEDKQDENSPQDDSEDNTDNGDSNDIENSTVGDEDLSDTGNKTDDEDIKQEDDEDSNDDSNEDVKQQSDDDKSDDDPEQDDEDLKSDGSSLKEKALDKIDPNLSTASKLKDLSKMNKEEAKEELIQITKSMAKKKILATVSSYLLPIILPVIIGIIAIVLFSLIMITALNIIQNDKEQDEGCSVVDKQSTNISDSKDAEKNAMNIYKYTKKHVKGATNKGISSWLGNVSVESAGTFSSSTIQGGAKYKESLAKDPSAGGYAFGFAQLDSERRVALLKYSDKKHKKWSDMPTQLDYVLNHDSTDSNLLKKKLKQNSDISKTTEEIMNEWERAGDKDSISKRQAAAKKYYSKISKEGKDSDSNIEDSTSSAGDNSDAGSNSGCNKDSNSKSDGELGDSVKANDKSGKVIKKWSSKKKIPEKYKKHITLPDYKGEKLNSKENIFPAGGNKGQCTELTFSYMSQLYKGKQPTNGNGNVIYKAYKSKGAKTTANPTVGYGFSSDPPYAGAADSSVGHTGVVIGVMPDGKWIMSNYNLNGEANKDEKRVETFALVDGNKKDGGTTFFSGVGGAKIKSK